MKNKFICLLISAMACFCLSPVAVSLHFNQISQIYFFGDSLTDSGFNDLWSYPDPLPSGKAPTFTTFGGYVWSQYVARDVKGVSLPIYPGPVPPDTLTNNFIYNKPPHVPGFVSGELNGINYAAAGSTTHSTGVNQTWAPSLHQQITEYLAHADASLDPQAVYFIWSGANDILKLVLEAPPVPSELDLLKKANQATKQIADEIVALNKRGAKRIVILNLPDIGNTPLISAIAKKNNLPLLPVMMTKTTVIFNALLAKRLLEVKIKHPVKILAINANSLFYEIVQSIIANQPYVIAGQSFKFENYTQPACLNVSSALYCSNTAPDHYIFADGLHPTDMAHRVLSLKVEQKIKAWK